MYDPKFSSALLVGARSSAGHRLPRAPALDTKRMTPSAITLYANLNVPASIAPSSILALGILALITPGRLSDVVAAVAVLIAMMVAASHAEETSA